MTVGVAAVILGGVGIFLTGMILLTDGLKAAAGDSLRSGLQRFARTPARGLASGTAITALVQSSSATTLTTIGFVSAGLLTFPQAVGVIFGANLGTTSTGWIVSVLGLRVSVGALALPLVGAGALMRLLGRGRVAHGGMALVGFGLIFVGIDTLQVGMEGLAERIDPGSFPGETLPGKALLVLLGVVMTVVMQSSSAAVATTLTALYSGSVGFEQAALLVVGQNMGTTVKAALASIGGTVPVRRTAAAHILFNLATGALALALFPFLLAASLWVVGPGEEVVAVALFHSAFNLLGVAALFPVVGPFARWVERLVPETERRLTRNLHSSLTEIPSVAVEAARRTAVAIAVELFRQGQGRLFGSRAPAPGPPTRETAGEALMRLRSFLTEIHTAPGEEEQFRRHLSALHATDHLERLRRSLKEEGPMDAELSRRLDEALGAWGAEAGLEEGVVPSDESLGTVSREIADSRKARRARLLEEGVVGDLDPEAIRVEVDGLLRLDSMAYHAWRAAHHLRRAAPRGDDDPVGGDQPVGDDELSPGPGWDSGWDGNDDHLNPSSAPRP